MAIVTGDRYLDKLVKFVEAQAGPLIDGTLVLKLNPAGLHYVQLRLESLQELDRLLAAAPVDYLRAYISDLGDHRALEQLRRILRLLTSLKVVSVLPPPARDPTPLSLLPFGRLRFLELRGCDLSTSAARGLLELRHTLEKLICHNSTDALRHIFASRIADIKKSPQWNRLSFVSCACNSMVLMDESLQLLPAVETLDLSRNRLSRVDNLRKCVKLKHLDLGFNNLRTISSFSEVSCNMVKLVLRNNALTSLRGIENLKSLEGLDISYNLISSFFELEILSGLTLLQSLWLEGNPVCSARWYRPQVFSLFTYPERLMLDNNGVSTREYWKRQIIIASRQKQPSSFGFYYPAKTDAEGEGSIPRKKKKQSRLASIESGEESLCMFSDQDSGSSHNEVPSKEESAGHDDGAEIVDLINRVEHLKKERSILWLREVKEWMGQAPENMIGTWDSVQVLNLLSRSNQRDVGESSKYISDSVQASGEEKGIESDHLFAEKAPPLHDQLNAAVRNSGILLPGNEGMNLQEMRQSYSHELIKSVSAHVKALHSDMLAPTKKHHVVGNPSESALTALGNSVESPRSPPYYRDDILHRRQNLVEEILQLSADSYSVASSDSDSSCSEDDLCEYGSSFSSVNQASEGMIIHLNADGRFVGSSYKGNCSNNMNGRVQHAGENGKNLVDSLDEEVVECSLQTNSNESLASNQDSNGVLADSGTGYILKRRGKRKAVKRVISFSSEKGGLRNSGIVIQSSVAMDLDGLQDETEKETWSGSSDQESDEREMQQDALGARDNCSFKLEDVFIESYFNKIVTEAQSSETCTHYLRCDCVLEQESIYREREVAVVLSSEQKLYVLLIGIKLDGSGAILSVLGIHVVEDVKDVYVSMGLQVVRICIGGGPTYVLIVRNMEKSRQLLGALQESANHSSKKSCSLRSVESIQMELFSKHICRGSNANVYLYSMIQFWENQNSNKDKQWSNKSLFVTRHHLLLCIEDIRKFSALSRKSRLPPYFSLVLCCSIADVLEMVIEEGENGSVILELEQFASKFPPDTNSKKATNSSQDLSSRNITWKFKWPSETNQLQFVTLLKTLHSQTSSRLFVRSAP